MISSSSFTSLAALAAALVVGCDTPSADISIAVTRPDTATTVDVEVCPTGEQPGNEFCTLPQELFTGETELTRHADINIGDNTTEIHTYLSSQTGCMFIDILLEGQVEVGWTVGSADITCSPLSACAAMLMTGGCSVPP
jgi:hypothetical protein|nr:hypothetical protein [Kofleriaceae bacterium]